MAKISRRTLLQSAAFAGLGGRLTSGATHNFSIGVTDWNLRLGANPAALTLAAQIGFEGVQVSFGRRIVNDRLPLDDPEIISRYLSLSGEHKIPINGTCVDKLHDNGLKSDRLAIKWVLDSIRLTTALKTKVLLLPFFGKWAIQNQDEGNAVADALSLTGLPSVCICHRKSLFSIGATDTSEDSARQILPVLFVAE